MKSVLVLVFVSYMFIYALYLIEHLDQPFRHRRADVDDVSIYLLRDFVESSAAPEQGRLLPKQIRR